jgi:hypothetical protein
MKKTFLVIAIASFTAASCTKSDVAPVAATNHINGNFSNSLKATPVITPTPAAKGGPGGGGNGGNGGAAPAPPTNLQIFTGWQTGTWASFIGVAGTTQTVDIQVIYNANGTYSLTATNSITGLLLTSNGTWSLTTPASLPLGEYVLLTLTSGGKVLMSGVQHFFHPGVAQWTVTTNNLPANLHATVYGVQKL